MTGNQKMLAMAATAVVAALLKVFQPKSGLEVWEYAEKNLKLPPKETRMSGPIRFDRTPYMVGEWSPLWAYRRFRECDNIWAAQTGKTTMLQVTMCYDADVDPGPEMIVYPEQKSMRRRSKHHLRPIIETNLQHLIPQNDPDAIQNEEYTLTSMTILLGYAGSPSVLAGEPIKYLKLDEEGKFTKQSKTEADSKELAMRRLISYGEFARAFNCTTPSMENLPGWRDWPHSTQCQVYVPCPKCSKEKTPFDETGSRNKGWQVMYFSQDVDRKWFEKDEHGMWSGGIKWDRDKKLTREQRVASAYYECQDCGAHWTDLDKKAVVGRGVWVARNPGAARYTSHLASWYAPWVKFSEVVTRWFDSYRNEGKRHDFLNADCAVPYEEEGKRVEESHLKKLVLNGHKTGMVPPEAAVLMLTADVHDDHIRYRVRAHASHLTSWGVAEGRLMKDLTELDKLLARTYKMGGAVVAVNCGLIDARWRTDEVYQFCLRHEGVMYPAMGHENLREIVSPSIQSVVSDPDQGLFLEGKVTLINFHDARWKTMLFNRLELTRGEPGYMYLEEGVSDQYYWEMQGEQKVEKANTRGQVKYEWKLLHDNHALDCEKLQLVGQQVFQIAAMAAPEQSVDNGEAAASMPVVNPYTNQEV